MGSWFDGGLTKSGLQSGGNTTFYDSPEQTMQAANDAYPAVNAAAQGVPELTPNGGIEFKPKPVQAPKVVKPSFAQASESVATNPSKPSGMTRAGFLVNMLQRGLQGGLAAAGSRTVGEGFQRGYALPFQQAAMRENQRQEQLDTQIKQEAVNQIPFARQQRELQAQRDNLISTPRGIYDISTRTYIPGTEPDPRVSSPEQQAYDALVQSGKSPVEALQAVKAAGQRPDTSLSDFELWAQAFERENGRKPGTADISSYQKTKAQNIHVNTPKADQTDSDIQVAAQQLADPRNLTALKDITSWRGDQRLKVFAAAKKINPNLDIGVIQHRIKYLQSYEDPKGRAAINRQAINNILQHGADLRDLNDKYRARSEFRPLNTPINAIAKAFGSTAYTEFQTVNNVLKDELSLYFAGGYAPSKEQQDVWNKIQADEATPAQTEAFAREVARLAFRRANTFNSQFKKNMGYDDPDMINPEAKNAAEKLGLGDEVAKFGSGGDAFGKSSAPFANQSQPKSAGVWVTNKDGIRELKTQ